MTPFEQFITELQPALPTIREIAYDRQLPPDITKDGKWVWQQTRYWCQRTHPNGPRWVDEWSQNLKDTNPSGWETHSNREIWTERANRAINGVHDLRELGALK